MDCYNILSPININNNAHKSCTITQTDCFFSRVHFQLPIYVHKYFVLITSVVCRNKTECFQDKAVDELSEGLHVIFNN